jgi:hypothetical protein
MRMAYQKGVHGEAREVYGPTVGIEWKSGIEKDVGFFG